jgi:geranylgeranyl diphosphate synthase, type I
MLMKRTAKQNKRAMLPQIRTAEIDSGLREVRKLIEQSIRRTSLRHLVDRFGSNVSGGKMLRARLVLHLGPSAGMAHSDMCKAGAAVEMLQTASLLHDDVLDGSTQRRGKPAFWVSEGTKAAILVGDLLVSGAAGYILAARPRAMPALIDTLREMCDAEAEQEFHLFDEDKSWDRCVSIAQRKTGSLFGLAACCCAGEESGDMAEALRRAGYAAGTAYQLGDDLLDTCADGALFDKTLGTDADSGKLTAATSLRGSGQDPAVYVEELLRSASAEIAPWPSVRAAWDQYVGSSLMPVIERFLGSAAVEFAS